MKAGRIVAIVIGALIAIPAMALLIGGGVLAIASAVERSDDGFFDATLERLSTATPAITTEQADLFAEPGPPEWFLDFLDVTVRVSADPVDGQSELFIGIGPEADVATYLDGVAHDEIVSIDRTRAEYRTVPGAESATPPTDEAFWAASASGPGTQELTWDVVEGSWVAVLMNADGSAGVIAEVTVGVQSGALVPIAVTMMVIGIVLLAIAVVIIVLAAAAGRGASEPEAAGEVSPAGEPVAVPATASPVSLQATLDPGLSQWLWLVKWFLAIPHFIVLAFLWIAFWLLTLIAFFAILFTGRYPKGMFDFNVGVMRWSWRVGYYAGPGGLGTDRYPPFTTAPVPDYPATLDIAYPDHLSHGLVLVKWWLLAIPHYLVVAVLLGWGTGYWWNETTGEWVARSGGIGLISLLVFIAAVALLFTGRYPRALFSLIIGLNRWVMRVMAYVFLMTDEYPPFRLDQGGAEQAALPPDAGVTG